MTKKQRLALSGCLCISGALLAVYGAGFSWRQVLIGGIAFLIWQLADEMFKAAYGKSKFTRFQFRIVIDHLGPALKAAGLYGEDLTEATVSIYENMTGKGWITFTWLEPDLFYINTNQRFTSRLELDIDLPPFGTRQTEHFRLSDMIEMRGTSEGYELVLLSREQRYALETMHGKGIVLFKIPYKFFWSLQGDPIHSHTKATEILTAYGFTYHSDIDYWFYQNEYGSFRFWDV